MYSEKQMYILTNSKKKPKYQNKEPRFLDRVTLDVNNGFRY